MEFFESKSAWVRFCQSTFCALPGAFGHEFALFLPPLPACAPLERFASNLLGALAPSSLWISSPMPYVFFENKKTKNLSPH